MSAGDRAIAALREAARDGVRLMPRGSGEWWPGTTDGARALDGAPAGVTRVDAGDHVATVGAGTTLATLDRALAADGAFVALDAPGGTSRTLGGVLAAGSAGPLAALYGPPRDQVLGLTFVAGTGVVARTGGRVVKNVAGFDLAKAIIGAHGAFGFITEVHLRLRARPAADRTRAWSGDLPRVEDAARRLLAAGAMPAAFEVTGPGLSRALGVGDTWSLLVRALGTDTGVEEELAAAAAAVMGSGCAEAPAPGEAWPRWRSAVGAWPAVLRVGADPASWPEGIAAVERHAGRLADVSITVPRGTVRVGLPKLVPVVAAAIRVDAARRGWPVTLERADAATRASVGVWGALPAGVGGLIERLRAVFDPLKLLAVPLAGA